MKYNLTPKGREWLLENFDPALMSWSGREVILPRTQSARVTANMVEDGLAVFASPAA